MAARRFELYLVTLDPTVGSEINKTRPCVVISPDEVNIVFQTVIVAPLTSSQRRYPMRVPCRVNRVNGSIALDQMRSVDRSRLVRALGVLDEPTGTRMLDALQGMFAP